MQLYRINGLFWLLWLLLLGFCYFNSADDPSSIFFDKESAFDLRFSATRTAEIDRFLIHVVEDDNNGAGSVTNRPIAATPETSSSPAPSPPLLCVGIPSINRTTTAFLGHTVGSLVDTLTPGDRADIFLVVLLADRDPSAHEAYGQAWLDTLADEVLVYDHASDLPGPSYRSVAFDVDGSPRGDGRVENMRKDHSVLVEACRRRGSPYFALVEDDVVASRDWFPKLARGLGYVENAAARTGRDWLYLRLFYSELFMGWNSEEFLDYAEVVFLVYLACLLAFVELRRRHKLSAGGGLLPGVSAQAFNYVCALVLGLWVPALIALYFMAGRVAMHRLGPFPLSGVREMPRYGCCAQGLVFPERHLEGFQRLLRDPPYDFPGDMRLEGWAGDRGLSKWALDPSVLQHVGFKESSEGPRRAEVWNFSFERQHKAR